MTWKILNYKKMILKKIKKHNFYIKNFLCLFDLDLTLTKNNSNIVKNVQQNPLIV